MQAKLSELETLLQTLPPDGLPRFLGDLRRLEAIALQRLSAPVAAIQSGGDRLLTIAEASERLGQSGEWIYKHQKELPFVRHLGRSLRCSSMGIDLFIKRGK